MASSSSGCHHHNNRDWSYDLQSVLNDRPALDAFLLWMSNNDSRAPIELYFAIVAYRALHRDLSALAVVDDKKLQTLRRLTVDLYKKFISRKSGVCAFLQESTSSAVREVITQLTTADRRLPPVQLFDECHTQVVEYLTAQHRVFITSDEFIDLWNEAENASPSIPSRSPSVASSRHDDDDDDQQQPIDMMLTPSSAPPLPPPRNSVHQPGPTLHPRRSTTRATHGKTTGALTKHALRDTQQDREQLLGKTEFERASHTNVKFPYVGAATTSKNDSAVSSAFSSEASANHGTKTIKRMKEEQRKINPPANIIPRNAQRYDGAAVDEHKTPEGRAFFASKLVEKLKKVEYDQLSLLRTCQNMTDIGNKRLPARDVVAANYQFTQEHPTTNEEDDDVDNYVNRKVLNYDSSKASSGSQRSPAPTYPPSNSIRRRSPKSSSPERHMLVLPNAPLNAIAMTSSTHTPYSSHNGFAPHPSRSVKTTPTNPTTHYNFNSAFKSAAMISSNNNTRSPQPKYDQRAGMAILDTSGIESMVSSKPGDKRILFEKARRQMATFTETNDIKSRMPKSIDSRSLPGHATSSIAWNNSELVIGYKYSNSPDHAPYVKKVERGAITLSQFKAHFSLGPKKAENAQFYFKKASDDATNPHGYELLLITDDSAVLPIFDGRIMAEVKSNTDSD